MGSRAELRRRARTRQRAQERSAQLLHLDSIDKARRSQIRAHWWVELAVIAVLFLLGVLLFWAGICGGIQVNWDFSESVAGGSRLGGPLWLHLPLSLAVSALLMSAVLQLPKHVRRYPPSEVKLKRYATQKDLR
ncbi:hypothetical protein [Nesterenkonia alkaliphila]|uniref:Uncharacterized protein n=1 Tax=Nesterenkonia alkaliphila TaxID=1463631 RepID=A0A7K1UKN2_9MICC|nr:hypothetical protein [Nesterenkonia alkaliphila]MVT27043.1 hypothetical protein [Nesterenkonia alkaliphila]GFZ93922.1 hypothetical protein GCM10011359_24280 [Nesterenkonia alkaliphila]